MRQQQSVCLQIDYASVFEMLAASTVLLFWYVPGPAYFGCDYYLFSLC